MEIYDVEIYDVLGNYGRFLILQVFDDYENVRYKN